MAERLAAKSEEIAGALDAGDVCTAAVRADELQDETLRAINAGDVPPELQEDLSARVNELVNEVNCNRADDEDEDDDKKKKKRKKKKDKGNGNEQELPTEPIPTEPIPTETDE